MKFSWRCYLPLLILVLTVFNGSQGLAQQEQSQDTVSALIKALNQQDERAKVDAIRRLSQTRPVTPNIIAALEAALKDASPSVRHEAALAFTRIGPAAESALPALVLAVSDKKEAKELRLELSRLMSRIELPADIISSLLSIVQDPSDDELVRKNIITSIGKRGGSGRSALPILLKVARRDLSKVVQVAAWAAIANIEPENHEATEKLLKLSEDKTDTAISDLAIRGLVESGQGERAVPILVNRLTTKDLRQKWVAIIALGVIGPAAAPAVPSLILELKGQDKSIRGIAIGVLGKIGPSSKQAIPALKDIAANDPDPDIRKLAAEALGKIEAGDR